MEKKISKDSFGQNTYTRFADKQDIPRIMQFIHDYWAENHILAHDREIFDFQYVYGDEVCFVLSLDKETDEIEGVLGYIPYDTEGDRDIFTALWKVRKSKNLFQGMDQLYYLEENGKCKNLYCVGINESTFSIYKYMRKKVAKLEHFYMLQDLPEYRIAVIQNKYILEPKEYVCAFHQIGDFAELQELYGSLPEACPRKSLNFLQRRYFRHPEYEYRLYHIQYEDADGVLIGREQAQNGSRVFRILDFLGEEKCFAAAGGALKQLMLQEKYEYIDIYEYGMAEDTLQAAGFVKVMNEDGNVIPNYFEPFVQENIDIHIFLPRDVKGRMFKGDGDQDRPNFRKK